MSAFVILDAETVTGNKCFKFGWRDTKFPRLANFIYGSSQFWFTIKCILTFYNRFLNVIKYDHIPAAAIFF